MKRFKVGDPAKIVATGQDNSACYLGTICFIEELDAVLRIGIWGLLWDYRIRLCDGGTGWAHDSALAPIDPPAEDVYEEKAEELEA